MNILKKALFAVSPSLYFFSRDWFQYSKNTLNGSIASAQQQSQGINTFEQAFDFAKKHLEPYQIKSEIKGLITLLQTIEPKQFIEIGTANSGTHYLIRHLCPSIQESIAIDIDIRNRFLVDKITNTPHPHYIFGYSTNASTLTKVQSILNHKAEVDVLFIDGDHSYEGVKSDFEHYYPLVRSGGHIVFHDIIEDWNTKHGRKTNKFTGGVPKFFMQIKNQYQHYSFVENQDQDGFGIGVIVKP